MSQVLHNSAAKRKGMQVLDRIVSVNGLDMNNEKVIVVVLETDQIEFC